MQGTYRFGEFVIDAATRELRHGDEVVHLSTKAFRLLSILIESAPRALSKAELQDLLWPDTFVVEANLQHLIGEIRAALADDARKPRFVRTVHGFGYAFRHSVSSMRSVGQRTLTCVVTWEAGRVTLAEGEHTVGRDPAATS